MSKWIVSDDTHLGGAPRVRDTRISVSLLLESFAAGMTVDDIVEAYPGISPESIQGVMGELAQKQESAVA